MINSFIQSITSCTNVNCKTNADINIENVIVPQPEWFINNIAKYQQPWITQNSPDRLNRGFSPSAYFQGVSNSSFQSKLSGATTIQTVKTNQTSKTSKTNTNALETNSFSYTNEGMQKFVTSKSTSLSTATPYVKDNIEISDEEVKSNTKIQITDYSGDWWYNKTLVINASGLECHSLRQVRDGYTYFGVVSIAYNKIINDYIINNQRHISSNISINKSTSSFSIFFNRETKEYHWHNYEKANKSMYIKLSPMQWLPWTNETQYYFQIAETLLMLNPSETDISLITTSKANKDNINYIFHKTNEVFQIGRSTKCKIKLNDQMSSKINCCIRYNNQDAKWEIIDGHNQKESTNGTWMLCVEDYILFKESKDEPGKNITTSLPEYVKWGKNVIKIEQCL